MGFLKGLFKEYGYMLTHPIEVFHDDFITWCLATGIVALVCAGLFIGMFIHDTVELKKPGFILDAQTENRELTDGKRVQIDEYTVLFEYKLETASESGKNKNCVIGLVDKETKEIRYILVADVEYITLDIDNIGKTEPLPGTEKVLFTKPIKGELAFLPGVDALPQEVREGLNDQGLSDAQIESECSLYSLKNVEKGHEVFLFLRRASLTAGIGLTCFFALISVITGVLHVKTRKKPRGPHSYDDTVL